MKVDKAPTTFYFEHGYVSFNKRRADSELYYKKKVWVGKDHLTLITQEKGQVKDETHLKELQSNQSVVGN